MSVFLFFVILIVLIIIHELGHFSLAKYFGIRVDEFGIGFPPKIFGIKKGETLYSINAIPFGGFVKIFGENPDDDSISGPDSSRSLVNKSKWAQIAVLIAGVKFNAIFAWLIISLTLMIGITTGVSRYDQSLVKDSHVAVTMVEEKTPAHTAGFKVGDEIKSLSAGSLTVEASTVEVVRDLIISNENKPIVATLIRDGETVLVTVTPESGIVAGAPAIGVGMDMIGTVKLPIHQALWEGLKLTVVLTIDIVKGLGKFFLDTILLRADLSGVTGPVGIVGMVGDASEFGFMYLLTFTAFISLNLAVINLLPFPALDGGRILFVIIEKIKGSPIKPVIANTLNMVGFLLLIALMLVVTAHDIINLFR